MNKLDAFRAALMKWERWCNETAFSEIDNLSNACANGYRECRDEGRRVMSETETGGSGFTLHYKVKGRLRQEIALNHPIDGARMLSIILPCEFDEVPTLRNARGVAWRWNGEGMSTK